MSKTYSKAPDEVQKRVADRIRLFFPDLHSNGVKFDLLSVASDDPDSSPLSHQGYPAAAVVSIVGTKERAKGNGDAQIILDEANYTNLTSKQEDALIDHELYHVELKRNKYKRVSVDEHGRPKLTMRKHDRQYGWFDEIAKRHGIHSGEVRQAMQLYISGKQTYFEFDMASELGDGVTAKVSLVA